MPVSLGTTTIAAIYLGTTSIVSAYLGSTQVFGGASAFTPLSLFSGGAQGIWLDPSDLSTMFSDRAGTTAVTTPGTVVGLRLDKSKGGVGTNGASRRNILSWTEDLTNAVWGPGSGTVRVADQSANPINGEITADLFDAGVGGAAYIRQATTQVAGGGYVFSLYAKRVTGRWLFIRNLFVSGGGTPSVDTSWFDLQDGVTGVKGSGITSTSIQDIGGGWFRCSVRSTGAVGNNLVDIGMSATNGAQDATGAEQAYIWGAQLELASTASAYQKITADWAATMAGNHAVAPTDAARPIYGVEPKGGRRNLLLATDTLATQSLTVTAVAHTLAFTGTGTVTLTGASTAGPLVGTGAGNRVSLTFTPTAASLTLTVSGSVTLGQLERASSATAYQKVVTAYDITESGVATCHYVQYDGSDDSMSTAAIDFTGTDKMSVFAGVRKLSDAAAGILMELSAIASNNGSFNISAPPTATATYASNSRGTANAAFTSTATYAAPISNVVVTEFDIAAPLNRLRINGTVNGQSVASQGTGNFGNYPLFIGRRNNTSLPFNGRDYGLIVVGKAASAGEITDTETWLAAKTAQVTL